MKIVGIQKGALLQRRGDTDSCDILLQADFCGKPQISMGELSSAGENRWRLTGIPVGGPYSLTIRDDRERVTFADLYVGDLWLLAGQSNMEGAGRMRECDWQDTENPMEDIRSFSMADLWEAAAPQLHRLWESSDPAHQKTFAINRENHLKSGGLTADFPPAKQLRGVGPGYFFARELHRLTGVPQGVIPTAVGGAPIEMWTPPKTGEDNYFTAARRRVAACGSHVRGIFWYQGEGYAGPLEEYTRRFEAMRHEITELFGEGGMLPCVQVQTFRCTLDFLYQSEESRRAWSAFRNHQLVMEETLPNLVTVANNDLDMDDCIHLSAASQETLGKRAALAMAKLVMNGGIGEPRVAEITAEPDEICPGWTNLSVKYKNVAGKLSSAGFPRGFTLALGDEEPSEVQIQHLELDGDRVVIRIELNREALKERTLWYGYGHNFTCNITDGLGRAIPSFGPVSLKNQI
ncbi:MAG: hypothetical protein IKU11_06850 [Clostridia bacterium]|nr:hypothetical protein [Clostridia bacterium]